ncbi:MAG: hypothetical protein LBD06_03000 [Candidatus Accumulibacter sp.]|jgi:hypothetical protein|nr:hypothetical protein [Accumulibacter sp.]
MALNYTLLAVTAILSVTGILDMVRGSASQAHPFRTVAAIIVFAIALFATWKGMDYATFKIMIESASRRESV